MLLAGFAYLALAAGSLALWVVGFNPYCGNSVFLGRSLLLWGAAAYACMAYACFGGVRRQYALAGATFLAVVHASFLTLAWRDFGYPCSACATFLAIELVLVVCLAFARGGKRYPVLIPVAGVFLLLSIGQLLFSSPVSVAGGASVVPAVADQKAVVSAGTSTSGERASGDFSAIERLFVTVTTTDGEQVKLDLSQRPAFYFTWWCPACREVLQEIAGVSPEQRPYLVAVCLAGVDTSRSLQELADLGIQDAELYITRTGPDNGLPVLVLAEGGQARTVAGRLAVLQEVMGRAGKL